MANSDEPLLGRLRGLPMPYRVTVAVIGLAVAFSHNFFPMPKLLHLALYFVGLILFMLCLNLRTREKPPTKEN